MNQLLRFTGICVVLIAGTLGILAVGGALSSSELWHNLVKVAELAGVIFVSLAAILLIVKDKK
jgi:hypothetical protein